MNYESGRLLNRIGLQYFLFCAYSLWRPEWAGPFPTPRSIPWPPLSLLCCKPGVHVAKSFIPNVHQRLNQRDTAQVDGLNREASLLFLSAARRVNTKIAQLQNQTFLGVDEEALLDDLTQFQDSLDAT